MIDAVPPLISLDPFILTAIVIGYIGYWIAFHGIDHGLRSYERVFAVLIFTVCWLGSEELIAEHVEVQISRQAFAALLVVFLAALWRSIGRKAFKLLLRSSGVSLHDANTTVWQSYISDSIEGIMQVVVTLHDGSSYMCDDFSDFHSAPYTGLLMGVDGSISMCVTHFRNSPGGAWIEVNRVSDDEWRDMVTFFPASEIKYHKLRVKSG